MDPLSFLSRIVSELRRRRVLRVAGVYLVAMWVVIQVAVATFPALRLPAWSVPLVICLAVLGLPLVLVATWAFEVTPEGVRRTRRGSAQEPGPALSRPAHVALTAGGVVLVGLIGWGAWGLYARSAASPPAGGRAAPDALDPNRVAILYLDDYSAGHGLDYLAKGLTETLIHELGSVDGISVISPNGVKPYRDTSLPIDSIGRALDAGTVVGGSVQGDSDRVRITVQLVDATTGDQVASTLIEQPRGDPFALQDSVSSQVTRFLRTQLGKTIEVETAREGADDPRAWKVYQMATARRADGDALRLARDPSGARESYRRADSLLEVAGELDPHWTRPAVESGWTHLAMARLHAGVFSHMDTALARRAVADAERVLAEHPRHARALELKGTAEWYLSRALHPPESQETLARAERDLREATLRDPGLARAWAGLATILDGEGEFEEARVAARRMSEADPYLANDASYLYVSAHLALEFGEFERADSLYARGERLYPEQPAYPSERLIVVASRPADSTSVDRAWDLLHRTESLLPDGRRWQHGRYLVAATLARAGLADSARAVERRARALDPSTSWVPHDEAYIALQMGDRERALALLDRYLRMLPGKRRYVARDLWWTPLHGDARFDSLVAPTGPVGP